MKKYTWMVVPGLLVILVTVILAFSYKTIHLEVDGERSSVQAFVWSAQGALRAAHVTLMDSDQVDIIPTTWFSRQMNIRVSRAAHIILAADGKLTMLWSASQVPAELLSQAGITLNSGDRLLANGEPIDPDQPLPAYGETRLAPLLQVQRQVAFSIAEAGTSQDLLAPASTLGAALWENGVVIHSADRITPTLDTTLTSGLELAYKRAQPIMISTNGITLTLLSPADSVGEALALAGYPPQGLDYTIPAERDPLPVGGLIHLVRVQEEVLIEQTPLPFETSYQPAPEVEIDNQVVLQTGQFGMTAQRIRVRYEDGLEVSRSTEAEWVAQPPQDRILGYGTKIVQRTTNTPDGPITYWRALQMYAVSYHPGETGGNITASGLEVRKGLAAVDIRYIPFYTQMYVPGYGPAMAADTGGGVVGRMIDLAYPTDEYVPWHEYVTVYFLWPPPDNIVWVIP